MARRPCVAGSKGDAVTIAYDEIAELADQLSVTEKIRLIDRLVAAVRQDQEVEAFRKMDWHEFLERTAGSLADMPMERPPQLPLEAREPFDDDPARAAP